MFKVHPNVEGWGPSTLPEQFLDVPYAPYNKDDRLGKVADFTSSYRNRYNRYDNASGVNAEFQYKHDTVEDKSFQLVDTIKVQKPKVGGQRQRFQQNRPQQRRQPSHQQNTQVRQKGQQQQNKRWDRLNKARRMQGPRRGDNKKTDRAASITVGTDWNLMEQYDLTQMTKLQANPPKGKDVCWAGSLKEYDDAYDRLTTRQDKKLERFDDVDFFYVSTSDDPIIAKEAEKDEKEGEEGASYVFATDAILSTLMAAPRSVYPWDILITREGNRVVFDKTDGDFDLVSVNETAFEPPQTTTPDSINNPDKLANEATMINQNFSQQILKANGTRNKKFATPNPFEQDGGTAGCAYRYREFDLGNKIKLFARTEVDAVVVSRGQEQYATSFALNEWDSKLSGTPEWRQKIDTQRGGVLANELKNNANKLAKWTAQSLIAGVEQMKVGYVSRNSRNDAYSHVILGTHTYKPPEFAQQIALSVNNMWGIVKMLSEFFMEQPEGKYVLMKDPNNPFVRIYGLPEDSSEDEE